MSEDANAIGCKSGEYGRFGHKLDALRARCAAALRHKNASRQEAPHTSSCRGANFGSIAAETARRRVSGSAEGARSAADATAVETAATTVQNASITQARARRRRRRRPRAAQGYRCRGGWQQRGGSSQSHRSQASRPRTRARCCRGPTKLELAAGRQRSKTCTKPNDTVTNELRSRL